MRKKSQFLQAILSQLIDHRGIVGGNVSAEKFLYTTFEAVNQTDYQQRYESGQLSQQYCEELRACKKFLKEKFVDDAWDKLKAYLSTANKRNNMFSVLMLSSIMANIDISEALGKKNAYEDATALEVVDAICKNPTQQIKSLLRQAESDYISSENEDVESCSANAVESTSEQAVEDEGAEQSFIRKIKSIIAEEQSKSSLRTIDDNGVNAADGNDNNAQQDATLTHETAKQKLSDIINNADELYKYLSSTVFGQEHAVSTFVSGYFSGGDGHAHAKGQTTATCNLLVCRSSGRGQDLFVRAVG